MWVAVGNGNFTIKPIFTQWGSKWFFHKWQVKWAPNILDNLLCCVIVFAISNNFKFNTPNTNILLSIIVPAFCFLDDTVAQAKHGFSANWMLSLSFAIFSFVIICCNWPVCFAHPNTPTNWRQLTYNGIICMTFTVLLENGGPVGLQTFSVIKIKYIEVPVPIFISIFFLKRINSNKNSNNLWGISWNSKIHNLISTF